MSAFQVRSICDLLRGSKANGQKTQAIVAGTGSGKSYGFQLGTLISLVHALMREKWSAAVHTALLYPRVALALDQRKGLMALVEKVNARLPAHVPQIRILIDAGSMLKTDEYRRLVDARNEAQNVPAAIEAIYADP